MEIQKINQEQMTLSVVSQFPRLQGFMGKASMNCLEVPEMGNKKDFITTYYASQNFKLKSPEYWKKGKADGFRVHYNAWMLLLNIRSYPDEMTVLAVESCLKNDYGHMNEKCVTDALKMNLRGEFKPMIEAYQLINENFLIKLLSAYNEQLREAHKIAVKLRDEANKKPDPTPDEIEAKNIAAMKSVFAEFKQTGNEELISGLYFDFFSRRGLIKLNNDQKLAYLETAKSRLKEMKSKNEGMVTAAKILKDIDAGGHESEVRTIGRKLAIIDFFKNTESLPF